jgi:hypothetical protein
MEANSFKVGWALAHAITRQMSQHELKSILPNSNAP